MSLIYHLKALGPPIFELNNNITCITEQEVVGQLQILNINKSSKPDAISPRVLRHISCFIYIKKNPPKLSLNFLISLSLSLTPKSLPFIGDKQMPPQFLKIKGKTRY